MEAEGAARDQPASLPAVWRNRSSAMQHAMPAGIDPTAQETTVGGRGLGAASALIHDDAARRHLLTFRFTLVNLVATALLIAAWFEGWVDHALSGDRTRLVTVIVLVFAAGLVECARRIVETSRELNAVRDPGLLPSRRVREYLAAARGRDPQSRGMLASALKLKLTSRIAPVRHVANSLVFLGLIGTVVGFIIALSGVDPAAASDVDAIGPMVSTLISGMSVALYTTLVGSILNIWLMFNYRLLEGGTVRLFTAVVERGERDA
jgi:hypothetical protein